MERTTPYQRNGQVDNADRPSRLDEAWQKLWRGQEDDYHCISLTERKGVVAAYRLPPSGDRMPAIRLLFETGDREVWRYQGSSWKGGLVQCRGKYILAQAQWAEEEKKKEKKKKGGWLVAFAKGLSLEILDLSTFEKQKYKNPTIEEIASLCPLTSFCERCCSYADKESVTRPYRSTQCVRLERPDTSYLLSQTRKGLARWRWANKTPYLSSRLPDLKEASGPGTMAAWGGYVFLVSQTGRLETWDLINKAPGRVATLGNFKDLKMRLFRVEDGLIVSTNNGVFFLTGLPRPPKD